MLVFRGVNGKKSSLSLSSRLEPGNNVSLSLSWKLISNQAEWLTRVTHLIYLQLASRWKLQSFSKPTSNKTHNTFKITTHSFCPNILLILSASFKPRFWGPEPSSWIRAPGSDALHGMLPLFVTKKNTWQSHGVPGIRCWLDQIYLALFKMCCFQWKYLFF